MGNELNASFRLMYFQPNPEDGERVCVALLFGTEREVSLIYDPEFPRLRCLAPHIDPDLVRFYLDDLEATMKQAPAEIELQSRRYSPQLVTSDPRKAAWPLSYTSRLHLIERFLSSGGPREAAALQLSVREERDSYKVRAHLKQFVQRVMSNQIGELHEEAKSQWVLGRHVQSIKNAVGNIRPVALALRKSRGVVLIDGIDLNVSTPGRALQRAGRVTHTFWQYKRIQQLGIDDGVRRVAIVLNGTTHPRPDYKDAHDFALDQFNREADFAIDEHSRDSLDTLRTALSG